MPTATATTTRDDDLATPLSEVTFVVLDLETTGTSPQLDAITEVGAVKYRGGELLGTFDTLVNPGVPIPPFISVLTGITEAMVLPAPRMGEVLPALLEFIGDAVLVGHNFRFDTSFLDAELLRRGDPWLPNLRVDTLALSRRLLRDETPDLKLGTIAAHLRVTVEPCHRARADAEATAEVFHSLLERAGPLGVLALDDLLAVPALRVHPSTNKLRLTMRAPRRPGVYRFRDRTGRVLYIGTATNLRAAVRGHFHGRPGRTVPQLVRETEAIDWIECTDAFEASVREARLVRDLDPRYNRASSDRRPYAYLKLTLAERFPRLAVVHGIRDDRSCYFGPLRSSATAQALKAAIESTLPLRRCAGRIGRRRAPDVDVEPMAACGVAACPCRGGVTDAEYQSVVDAVRDALERDPTALVALITRRLHELVVSEQFEEAAVARDQLTQLGPALAEQHVITWLRSSAKTRLLTTSGIVELEHGFLRVAGDDAEPAVDDRARPLDRRDLDEMLVVVAWIERELTSGRARVLDSADDPPPHLRPGSPSPEVR